MPQSPRKSDLVQAIESEPGVGQRPLGPTVKRRILGFELRKLRESCSLTGKEVSKRLEWSEAKVSRIETARNAPHRNDIRLLLDMYGVTQASRRDELLDLAKTPRQRRWWNAYPDVVPERRWVLVRLEDEAELLRNYEVEYIPGLLQTEHYATTTLKACQPQLDNQAISRRVEVRQSRQQVLSGDSPVQLWTIINEAALHRLSALPTAIANPQFKQLLDMSDQPHITMQVLPFSAGPHSGMDGPFTIVEFPNPAGQVVHVETRTASVYIEEPAEIDSYARVVTNLQAESLGRKQSQALIHRLHGAK